MLRDAWISPWQVVWPVILSRKVRRAYVVCGTTGESPTLSWQEQVKMLEAVRQAVGPGVKVLAGTGSNSTSEAVKATREAAEPSGADGALGGCALLQQASPRGLGSAFSRDCGRRLPSYR